MSNDEIQSVDDVQPVGGILPASTKIDEWVVEIGARLEPGISHATRPSMDSNNSNDIEESMDSNSSNDIEELPSIFGNWQHWDDFGASFIPETQKWQLVACMTHWFGLNVRSYLEYMQEKEDVVWSYYRGVVNEQFRAENSKRFIEHLLVSSCFLIFAMILLSCTWEHDLYHILYGIIHDKSNLPKGLTDKDIQNMVKILLQDPMRAQCYMLTMNYQIPWFVVKAVYTDPELSNLSKLFVIPIHKIALLSFESLYLDKHSSIKDGGTVPEGGFKHLLHIFHWSRTPEGKYLVDTSTKWIGSFHIPSAADLKLSQTVFVKYEGGSIDVSYYDRRLSRVMQLAPWHLFQYSTKLFESLLIFEQQYGICGFPFTAYVACMACLLKTEADIKELRANDVIPRTRFDDIDVLRCVQDLKTLIYDHVNTPNELVILEKEVMTHYQRSGYRIYGEFKSHYCSKPWITMSVIGAILLFVVTSIQTIFSILSYQKQ